MRGRHYTLNRVAVQERAAATLQHHLKLRDYSRKCTSFVVLNVLFAAAACLASIHAICRRLRGPSDETLRLALLSSLPGYAELQRRLNRALQGDLPKALRRKARPIAIDLTLIPYHGQPHKDPKEIYRSQPKSGTSHFHAYATAYVVHHGHRYTVALTPVEKGEAMEKVIQRLLRVAARCGVRPRFLLLDRGFYSVNVVRYLQRARYPFLMPAKFPGRPPRDGRGPAFRSWNRSGWSTHTLTNAKKQRATVCICVVCRNYRGKWKRHGRQRLIYAYWGIEPKTCQWVFQTYRLRFGIETSYRQLNQARIRTCTRNPLIRLFYIGLALLLRNLWVWLHYQVLATPRRGRRRLNQERLRFKTLLSWLLQLAEALLGVQELVATEIPIHPPVIANGA